MILLYFSVQTNSACTFITSKEKCQLQMRGSNVFQHLFKILKSKPVCVLSLTNGATQTLPLLSPFGITQNVNNERGELPGIETSQLLTALRVKKGIVYSLAMNYMDIIHNLIIFFNYIQHIFA